MPCACYHSGIETSPQAVMGTQKGWHLVNLELLDEVRTYRNWIASACEVIDQREKQRAWEAAHQIARQLLQKYGPVAFERIDNIAYYYS